MGKYGFSCEWSGRSWISLILNMSGAEMDEQRVNSLSRKQNQVAPHIHISRNLPIVTIRLLKKSWGLELH